MEEQDILLNLYDIDLLGYFNDKGEYVLPDIIVKNLIKTPKCIDKIDGDNIYCSFSTDKNRYNFLVMLNKNSADLSYGDLYLIENYEDENGENKKVLTSLAKCSTYSQQNIESIVKRIFKLSDTNQGKFFVDDDFITDTYRKEKIESYQSVIQDIISTDKNFVDDILNVLNQSGSDVADEIIKEFSKKLSVGKSDKTKLGYWLNAKKILDELIKKYKNKLKQSEIEKIALINNIFLAQLFELNKKLNASQKLRIKKYEDQLIIIGKQKTINNVLKNMPNSNATTQVLPKNSRQTYKTDSTMAGINLLQNYLFGNDKNIEGAVNKNISENVVPYMIPYHRNSDGIVIDPVGYMRNVVRDVHNVGKEFYNWGKDTIKATTDTVKGVVKNGTHISAPYKMDKNFLKSYSVVSAKINATNLSFFEFNKESNIKTNYTDISKFDKISLQTTNITNLIDKTMCLTQQFIGRK